MTEQTLSGIDTQSIQGFRMALRQATRPAHDRTEAMFADFLDDPVSLMDDYLTAQRVGIAALVMARSEGFGPSHRTIYERILRDLDADCADRDLHPPVLMHDLRLHPVAVDYILLGSRLGTEVIRRRLVEAGIDPVPRHFRKSVDATPWRLVCDRLDHIGLGTPLAEAVTADVATGFDLFARAVHMTLSEAAMRSAAE